MPNVLEKHTIPLPLYPPCCASLENVAQPRTLRCNFRVDSINNNPSLGLFMFNICGFFFIVILTLLYLCRHLDPHTFLLPFTTIFPQLSCILCIFAVCFILCLYFSLFNNSFIKVLY